MFVGLELCLKEEVVFVRRGVGYSLYCDCPKLVDLKSFWVKAGM